MGIVERKERQKAELRETILAAARRIAADEGLGAMTMRRIAEAIEYAPATIYLYFANRDEIALALVAEGFEALLAAHTPAAAIGDPIERLRALGRAYIAFGKTDPPSYRLIFMENPKYTGAVLAPDPERSGADAGSAAFGLLASTVAEAVAAGTFAPVDPGLAAQSFWAALHGIVSLAIACPATISDVDAVAAITIEALIAGLRA